MSFASWSATLHTPLLHFVSIVFGLFVASAI